MQCEFQRNRQKLNRSKCNDNHSLYPDHINKLYINTWTQCILIHGHNVKDLLASVIASIYKNLRS